MHALTTASLLFALGATALMASAEELPSSVQELSNDALQQLQQELSEWKQSAVGQEAAKNGFLPPSPPKNSIQSVGANPELQRLLDAKREIALLQQRQPLATFSIATPFALLTPDEFKAYAQRSNGPDIPFDEVATPFVNQSERAETNKRLLQSLPASVDWESYGCVTPVKSQGQCSTATDFAVVGAVESGYCIQSGAARTLVNLAETDVISCGPVGGKCNNPQSIETTFSWIAQLNGGSVCTAASYPYKIVGTQVPSCLRFDDESVDCTKPPVNIVGYDGEIQVPNNDVAMAQQVSVRPVVVELNSRFLQFYRTGVLLGDESACPSDKIDNTFLVTGYGEELGIKYWRLKSAWGTGAGDKGYFKIERGFGGSQYGACGVERSYHYPVFRSEAPYMDTRRATIYRSNTTFTGTTISTVTTSSGRDCSQKCRLMPECVAATWFSRSCTMFSSVTSEIQRTGYIAGRIVTRSETDKQCLAPEFNVDFPGNDFTKTLTATQAECCDLCNKIDPCGAYTWSKFHGGSCFLKLKKTSGVSKGSPVASSPYYISGQVYKCRALQQNTDFTGGAALRDVPAARAESCCAECRQTGGCRGFAWSSYNGGTCFLKTGSLTAVSNPGVISALV